MALTKKQVLEYITRWAQGEYIKDLLKEFGTHPMEMYRMIENDTELSDAHSRARKIKAELQVDELGEIADKEEDVYRARLKTDIRKWTASKFNAPLYGEKLDVSVNQSIDINALLLDARRRVRDATPIESTKLLDSKPNDTGLEPVDTLEAEDACIETIDDLI